MAEKKKGVKWIIILTILVLIAVTVTLIVVFLPKNTSKAVEQTDKQANSMFIVKDESKELYQTFQAKVRGTAEDKYGQETENVYNLSLSLNRIVGFYNDYLVFAESNKTFSNNYNKIMRNFNKANSYQEDMEEVIVEVNQYLGPIDTSFIEGAWREFRGYFVKYMDCYVNAVNGLKNVFKDCIPSGVIANEMTYLVLDNVDVYLECINANFEKSTMFINYLSSFTNYLNKSNNILSKYPFNTTVQNKVKLVQDFSKVYGEDVDLTTLIKSITQDGFTFERPVQDVNNVLDAAKSFLKGELSL